MNYLQTLEVSVVWENCYLNKSFRYACPGLEVSGDGAQALGGRHGGTLPKSVTRALPAKSEIGRCGSNSKLGLWTQTFDLFVIFIL